MVALSVQCKRTEPHTYNNPVQAGAVQKTVSPSRIVYNYTTLYGVAVPVQKIGSARKRELYRKLYHPQLDEGGDGGTYTEFNNMTVTGLRATRVHPRRAEPQHHRTTNGGAL